MPKQTGFLKVEGTLGDVSFYKNKDGFFLRSKGGVSKERILNDPAFKRTRENGSEFKTIANAGKLFRDANAILIRKAYDGGLSTRLMQILARVKNLDAVSLRGQRLVSEGLATTAGQALMRGYDLNSRSQLRSVFSAPYDLDVTTGKIIITDLVPAEMFDAPPHATHVSLQTAIAHVDFEAQLSEVAYSPMVTLPIDVAMATQSLMPSSVPVATGSLFYLFLVEFSQEVNGVQYALNNGNFNSLTVLEVV